MEPWVELKIEPETPADHLATLGGRPVCYVLEDYGLSNALILDRACRDCHSNETRWPWYSNVAPVSWFVIDHVNHGRSHFNYSAWARYSAREKVELLKAMAEAPIDPNNPMLPPKHRDRWIQAELALRALHTGTAHAALDRAQQSAEQSGVPALVAEVAHTRMALEQPAARLAQRDPPRLAAAPPRPPPPGPHPSRPSAHRCGGHPADTCTRRRPLRAAAHSSSGPRPAPRSRCDAG